MLTLFYQMKTKKSRSEINFKEYYYNCVLENVNFASTNDLTGKCRICLRQGTKLLNCKDHMEVIEVLQSLTDISFSEDSAFRNRLCKVCYKFIKVAVLFRKTAKYADNIFKQPVKEENNTFEQSEIHQEFSDSDIIDKETDQQWEEQHDVKKLKKEQVKYADKVICHICNKVVTKSYFKEHLTMHDADQNNYVCHVCGKSFRLRCAYHNHSLRHRTDFPYKCQFCPYRGRYPELLKNHMRTHTGDYRYMCTECPARFLYKSNLNRHILKHKEPNFKCDGCKRAFHTKLALQRHFEADHLGIKNHVCNLCGKAFGYRRAMMKHQLYVHKREKRISGRMPAYLQAQCENEGIK